MGKSDRNTATKQTTDTYNKVNAQQDANNTQFQGMLGDAQTKANAAYGSASDTYNSATGGMGAYDPGTYSKVSGQNDQNIATGGYDAGKLADVRGQQQTNITTAGYNPDDVTRLNQQYKDLTANGMGGINSDQAAKIRSGYGQLADTGGISNDTADAMRRQTTEGIASTYSTLGQNMARKNAAAGLGGGGGETAELARQLGNTQGTALTGVNAQIGQLRQTGTIAGLGGLSTFEQGAASAQRGAVGDEASLATSQANNRITATGQQANTEASVADNRLKASQANQDLATNAANQRIQAAGGLANLYSSDPGYVRDMVNSILQNQQVNGTLTTEQNQIMQEISKQPGLLTSILNGVTQIGGAAAGVMTGIGAYNKSKS